MTLNSAFFFFNDTATTEIYTLSLHDALPISLNAAWIVVWSSEEMIGNILQSERLLEKRGIEMKWQTFVDRKSTRLNSSHSQISYAVFCLKNKTFDQGFSFVKRTVSLSSFGWY